jgi:hypothetical protein
VKASCLSSLYRQRNWKTLAVFPDFPEMPDVAIAQWVARDGLTSPYSEGSAVSSGSK